MNMDESQAEILLTNKVHITEGNVCDLFVEASQTFLFTSCLYQMRIIVSLFFLVNL